MRPTLLLSFALSLTTFACSAETVDTAVESGGSAVDGACPSSFAGHATRETAIDLGTMKDGEGRQLFEREGALAVGETVFFRVAQVDETNLTDPAMTVAAYSVISSSGALASGAASGLDLEATYVCNAAGPVKTSCISTRSDEPTREGTCDGRGEIATLTPDCTGGDESGVLFVRVHRREAPDAPRNATTSCGHVHVSAAFHLWR